MTGEIELGNGFGHCEGTDWEGNREEDREGWCAREERERGREITVCGTSKMNDRSSGRREGRKGG